MLNIAEQLGIRNARRNGLRPYRTRNNSRGGSAEETAAGQCRRLAVHGPVSITGRSYPQCSLLVGWDGARAGCAAGSLAAVLCLRLLEEERFAELIAAYKSLRRAELAE
jgi:hypothetical protein